jgi:hypothetical protein
MHRGTWIAATDEVGMQRMCIALITGIAGCHQCLPQDVTTKQIAKSQIQTLPEIVIGLDAFELEQVQKVTQRHAWVWVRHGWPWGVFLHLNLNRQVVGRSIIGRRSIHRWLHPLVPDCHSPKLDFFWQAMGYDQPGSGAG